MGKAKHRTETMTKEPRKGDFSGHRGCGSLNLKNQLWASSGKSFLTYSTDNPPQI